MTKARLQYVCQSCGYTSSKWLGRCPSCGEWNSLVEEVQSESRAAAPVQPSVPVAVTQVATVGEPRLATGIRELDRVLGGGLVPGSLVLIGGDPGIGKSTLALQLAGALARDGRVVLYVSGEESPRQAKMRAERIALRGGADHLYLHPEIDLDAITTEVDRLQPSLLVVDS